MALGAALVFACTGCVSSQKVLDTRSVLSVFRQAGFHDVVRRSTGTGSDLISIRGFLYQPFGPLAAVRFATVDGAKRRLKNDQPLLHGTLSRQDRAVLPRGFDLARLVDVRVCNVVVWSYNRNNDPTLASRLERAIAMLRRKC